MRGRTDRGGSSEREQTTRPVTRPDARSRHRLHGWTIAVTASALLWGGVIWTVWAMVGALT